MPLLVVATYVLAPLPNWICGRCANPDDFVESSGSAVVDFGRFVTGFLVLMGVGMSFPPHFNSISLFWGIRWFVGWKELKIGIGLMKEIALPAVLAHSEIIRIPAMIMSIIGGLLIYGTIISFGMFFQEEQEF
jgi:hypothetical protein